MKVGTGFRKMVLMEAEIDAVRGKLSGAVRKRFDKLLPPQAAKKRR